MSIKVIRALGAIVFCVGVGLLASVFFAARTLLGQPPPNPGAPANLTGDLMLFVARVGFLFIMAYCGSSIAGRGVQLYQATLAGPSPTLLPPSPPRE